MAEGYAYANSAAFQNATKAVLGSAEGASRAMDRPMTEMENLCAQLAETARRLTIAADKLSGCVNSFMQQGQTVEKPSPATPEPQPGTLSALRYWHRTIDEQTQRLTETTAGLSGIL